jgi:Cu/Ag efflux pump CusA
MANGARADQARADRGNARDAGQIPGVAFNFSQPIRDSVEESTSGARGQVVLKLFGPDIPSCAAFFSRPWTW